MPAKHLVRINDEATYLHIYNRGIEGRSIFNDETDYQSFLTFLKEYLTPQDPTSLKKDFEVHGRTFKGTPHLPKNYFNEVELIAYSLIPDHFHLILHQKTRGSIERFLRSLGTRYSMYFNKKYKRVGSLFEGPYKSVSVKDVSKQLPLLTRYLNEHGNHSSHPEYLGERNTPWVKPQTDKNFAEETISDKDKKELLDGITFDGERDQLERSLSGRNLASEPDLPPLKDLKVRSRMPQFLTISTLGFVLLVTFSVWNINVSAVKSPKPLPSPAVLSETTTTAPSPTPPPATSEVNVADPSHTSEVISEATAEAAIKSEPKPETSLTVKIDDDSPFVNIRQKPTISSEKIGQANDGDTFEFISLNAGWYEIKLTDGSIGFISARYALKEETN